MIVPHSRPTIDEDDIKAVTDVLASGKIAQGEKVREFESALARFVGTKYAVACSSGTASLYLALLSLDLGAKDEVIMPSYVCPAIYFATLRAGAIPKLADISLADFNICAETVKPQITSKTKALVVPHMFGTPAELDELLALGIPIIEDCAQSLGATLGGRKVGSFGDLSIFSFYATKMITTGEGGMVLTNDDELYAKIADFREYDKKAVKRDSSALRFNFKMTDFQAALGVSQLKKLPRFIQRRRDVASLYNERFSEYDIETPRDFSHKRSVSYRYVLMVDNAEEIRKTVRRDGVICEKPVSESLHQSLSVAKLPYSDKAHEQALSVPVYPSLTEAEIAHVLETFDAVCS